MVRTLAIATAVALTLVTAPAGPTRASAAPAAAITEAPDEASALAAAKRVGTRVEVSGQRTETAQVFANPSGSMTLEQHAVPVRTRKDGRWVGIDTNLTAIGGVVAPVATTVGLSLSGGGSGPLVTLAKDGGSLALSWPAPLPKPRLAGDTATYPEVLPGVDLQVRATVDGFTQLLVVKHKRAAPQRIDFGLATTGLTLTTGADGTTRAVNNKGETVFTSGAPLMWDSTAAASERAERSPVGQRIGAMRQELRAGALTIIPDRELLATGTYPLYIDPSYSAGQSAWTYVNKDSPGTSYWTTKDANKARVGNVYGASGQYRSFFQMAMSRIANSTVKRAWFYVVMDHSAACGLTPVELWHTKVIDPAAALTWNNSASHWIQNLQTKEGKANEAGACSAPDWPFEFEPARFKEIIQDIATRRLPTMTVGLRIPLSKEGDQYHWKYFHPSSARVNVEFNTPPTVPSGLTTVPGSTCGTASAPTALNTSTPSFSAVPADLDGHNLTTDLEILQGESILTTLRSGTSGSGAAISWPALDYGLLPEDQPGTVFSYRARSRDVPADPVDALTGAYTPRCYFTVDRMAPGAATIASTDYPDAVPVRSVGETGTVTFTKAGADTDIAGFRYGFARETITLFAPVTANGTASVPITLWQRTPGDPSSIERSLYVRAVDRAGNLGPTSPAWTLTAKDRAVTTAPVRGDLNGDRRADVTALIDRGNGGTVAWNLVSAGTGFHPGYIGWDAGGTGGFPSYRVVSTSGDLDGDGRTDLAVFREDPDRTIRLYLLRSDGSRYDASDAVWSGTTFRLSHMKVVAGDIDADGDDDLVIFQGYAAKQTKMFLMLSDRGSIGAPVQQWDSAAGNWDVSRSKFTVGDFDGDGDDDVAGFYGYVGNQTKLWAFTSHRTGLAAPVQQWDSGAGAFDVDQASFVAGNPGGASRDAIFAMYTYGAASTRLIGFVSSGTPTSPAWTRTTWWDGGAGAFDATKATLVAGDYNADGRTDVAALYDIGGGSRRLYTFLSTGVAFADKRTDWEGNVGAAEPSLYVEPGRKYRLHPTHSDKCGEIPGTNVDNGAPFQQWSCNTGTHQQFYVERIGASPYFHLKIVKTGKCLDAYRWDTADNVKVLQWTCANVGASQPNQQFRLTYVEGAGLDVVVQPRIVHSDKCMQVTGAATADGTAIVQMTCAAVTHQRFFLRLEP